MSKSSYDMLIQRLDQFIRKFYLNKLIRGLLYSIGLVIGLFLLFSLLEHQFYFEKSVRKGMYFSFIGVSLLSIGYWVLFPLTQYFQLGLTISHEQAASIIGDHFSNVKDKLLNILQLKNQASSSKINAELIEASIDQKTESLKIVPFKSAIDLTSNKKYAKYALPPFLLLLVLLFAAPSLIKDSTHRIINNDKEFEKAAPFTFLLENPNPTVLQSEDITIVTKVEGDVLPSEVYVEVDDFQYRLKKIDRDIFSYTFKNVQKDTEFKLFSGEFYSTPKAITMLPKPSIEEFTMHLDYPGYTGRKDETMINIGDAFIPQGTKVRWTYTAKHTNEVALKFASSNKKHTLTNKRPQVFAHEQRIMSSDLYTVYVDNEHLYLPDSSIYNLSVSPDNFPNITVEQFIDSTENQVRYFVGSASDDYGLTSLKFNYTIVDKTGRQKANESKAIAKTPGNEWTYDHILDIQSLNLEPGDKLTYFFEVWDNDGVNGSKSSKTDILAFEKPTLEQFEAEEDANEEDIKDNVKEALKESKELKAEIRKLREKLLQKKELSWQEQKELEKLLEKQKEIQKKLEEAKQKFDENLKKQEEFNQQDEQIQEKQEQIQEMFEEVMDEEMKTLLEQIQELMQEMNKEEMMEQLEEFEMNEEMQEMEMDRLQELFKQLEFEKEMNELLDKLEELAEKQEELAKDTEEEKKPQEELKKEQEEIAEEFEKLEEELEKLKEDNEDLEFPKDLDEEKMEEDSEEVEEELEKSEESLEKKDNKKASKSQKSAAEKMKDMAGSLQQQMQDSDQETAEEDMQALRQLLENLITLSYDEEELIDNVQRSQVNTPRYIALVQEQFKLKEDFSLISDSLYALSKRVDQIESFVTEKLVETETRFGKALTDLEERKKPEADDHQRRIMKNVNDLALMLSESMEQMQQSMACNMPGNQQCNKPGGEGKGKKGKVPKDKISEGQQQLGEDLKQMAGKQGKGGKGSPSSKEFAEAAAKQAALRKALEDAKREMQEQGQGGQELQEIIDLMNKIEEDLVNKRLNNDLLKRQQDIETRLLQSDKADRKREKDNKRKGETAEQIKRQLPPELQKYLKDKESESDIYKKVSPDVYPQYQKMIEQYYNALKNN